MLNQWFSDNISAYILLFYKRCPFTLRKGTFTMQKTSNRALKGILLQINEIKLTGTLPAIRATKA